MAVSEVVPLSKPGILMKVPGWLFDQQGPLALRPGALPGILPWFLRFVACARHSKIAEIARDLARLTHRVYEDYAPLLDACPDRNLLGQRPIIEVFDSPPPWSANVRIWSCAGAWDSSPKNWTPPPSAIWNRPWPESSTMACCSPTGAR